MKYIKSINWVFTYKCNLKCTHCDIWDNKFKNSLDINKIKEIVNSEIMQSSYKHYGDFFDVAISGGEPLLVDNLKEIFLEIDKALPGSIHSISTNGILKEKLIDFLNFINDNGRKLRKINISIDGNEETHDKQRGIKGSFRKSIKTIQEIKKLFPNQIIEIKLTITKQNYNDISFLSKLAEKLGVFFSFKPAENMDNYTNQSGKTHKKFTNEEIIEIEKQIITNPFLIKQNYYISKYFFYNIPKYLRVGLGEGKKLCNIANDSVSIMPDGKIYSCILMDKVGDLYKKNIDEIWNGNQIKNQRESIKKGECVGCMLMCGSFKTKDIYKK